jgi:hypothetical protein
MPIPNRTGKTSISDSEQDVANSSFDKDFGVSTVEDLSFDGLNLQRAIAQSVAMKITVSGDVTYLAIAAPGTTQATARWQVRKLDATSGLVITWADGNADFDNVATDLTALSYS